MPIIELAERGLVPDALVRLGIRRLCSRRLEDEGLLEPARSDARFRRQLESLRRSPLALATDAANAQHYELPTRFFQLCLGRRLKYSSCLYPTGSETLDSAEEAMLARIFERIEQWTMTKTKFEAMEILNQYDIPCGPILSMKEIAEEKSLRDTGTVATLLPGVEFSTRWVKPQRCAMYSLPRIRSGRCP